MSKKLNQNSPIGKINHRTKQTYFLSGQNFCFARANESTNCTQRMNKKGKCGSKGCKKCYFLTIKARAKNKSHLPKSSRCPPTQSEEMSWKPSRTWVFSIPTNTTSGISRYLSVKKEANSNSSKAYPKITMPIRLSNFQSSSAAENLMPRRSTQKLTSETTSEVGRCWVDWLTVDARDVSGISASFWPSNRSSSNCIHLRD